MRKDRINEGFESANSAIQQESHADIQMEVERLEFEYSRVQERLLNLDLMLDNQGWTELLGGTGLEEHGPNIEQVKLASRQLRELVTVNAHMKQGNLLRTNYVWDGGIHYEGVSGGKGAGNKNIEKYIDDPQNQREFFGAAARRKRSKSSFTDGHVIYIGNDATKLLKAVSFEKVTGTLTNPEDTTEIWALRIMRQVDRNNLDSALEARWIFLDGFTDQRSASTLKFNGADEKIDTFNRIFIKKSNAVEGWRWGTPDALAAMGWVRMYREATIAGKKMSDAMAMIWAQAKGDTKQGAQNAAVQFSGNKQGSGGVAIGGPELATLATAGKGYDHRSNLPILAAAAASLQLSVIALSADPGAAGSSYGSAQTLDMPGRLAISGVRTEEAEFDEQILRWMGAKNPRAWFDTLLDADGIYREMQSEMFYWSAGLREAAEQKQAMDNLKGKPLDVAATVPTGVMTPNNEKFPGTLNNDSQPTTTTPSPDQGQSNGSGGAGNLGNQRKDTVGGDTGA